MVKSTHRRHTRALGTWSAKSTEMWRAAKKLRLAAAAEVDQDDVMSCNMQSIAQYFAQCHKEMGVGNWCKNKAVESSERFHQHQRCHVTTQWRHTQALRQGNRSRAQTSSVFEVSSRPTPTRATSWRLGRPGGGSGKARKEPKTPI